MQVEEHEGSGLSGMDLVGTHYKSFINIDSNFIVAKFKFVFLKRIFVQQHWSQEWIFGGFLQQLYVCKVSLFIYHWIEPTDIFHLSPVFVVRNLMFSFLFPPQTIHRKPKGGSDKGLRMEHRVGQDACPQGPHGIGREEFRLEKLLQLMRMP